MRESAKHNWLEYGMLCELVLLISPQTVSKRPSEFFAFTPASRCRGETVPPSWVRLLINRPESNAAPKMATSSDGTDVQGWGLNTRLKRLAPFASRWNRSDDSVCFRFFRLRLCTNYKLIISLNGNFKILTMLTLVRVRKTVLSSL